MRRIRFTEVLVRYVGQIVSEAGSWLASTWLIWQCPSFLKVVQSIQSETKHIAFGAGCIVVQMADRSVTIHPTISSAMFWPSGRVHDATVESEKAVIVGCGFGVFTLDVRFVSGFLTPSAVEACAVISEVEH